MYYEKCLLSHILIILKFGNCFAFQNVELEQIELLLLQLSTLFRLTAAFFFRFFFCRCGRYLFCSSRYYYYYYCLPGANGFGLSVVPRITLTLKINFLSYLKYACACIKQKAGISSDNHEILWPIGCLSRKIISNRKCCI